MTDSIIEKFNILQEVAPHDYRVIATVEGTLADAAKHLDGADYSGRILVEPFKLVSLEKNFETPEGEAQYKAIQNGMIKV